MQAALSHLPSFGVNPSSVRSVSLNSSGVETYSSGNGTQLYLIHVEYTAVLVGVEWRLRTVGIRGYAT